ncbi:MAG: hypothetical protein DMF63_01625 [Acidobacteria bacterium]|nr:MAG: hypothetical protein DMF63_01625 [Acidobacteriota bacterium]
MTSARFFFKLLIAMLAPAALAFVLVRVRSQFFAAPNPYSEGDFFSAESYFEILIFGILLLSFVLPILLTIREIQSDRSSEESPLRLTTFKTSADKLWK